MLTSSIFLKDLEIFRKIKISLKCLEVSDEISNLLA